MLKDSDLVIDNPEQTTYWIGDPAIDIENSNIDQWVIDGDGLIVKPEQEASLITYRGLTPSEMVELETRTLGERKNLQFYEAFRVGVIDIKGLDLRFSYNPRRILSDESYDKCLSLHHEIPLEKFIFHVFRARGKEANQPTDNTMHTIQLPFFVGGLILAKSFR